MFFEDDPRLRELCERASKEMDHDRLIDLVRQINDLLEKQRRGPANERTRAFPVRQPGLVCWLDGCAEVALRCELPGRLAMAW
jgi:hypothetical protein